MRYGCMSNAHAQVLIFSETWTLQMWRSSHTVRDLQLQSLYFFFLLYVLDRKHSYSYTIDNCIQYDEKNADLIRRLCSS